MATMIGRVGRCYGLSLLGIFIIFVSLLESTQSFQKINGNDHIAPVVLLQRVRRQAFPSQTISSRQVRGSPQSGTLRRLSNDQTLNVGASTLPRNSQGVSRAAGGHLSLSQIRAVEHKLRQLLRRHSFLRTVLRNALSERPRTLINEVPRRSTGSPEVIVRRILPNGSLGEVVNILDNNQRTFTRIANSRRNGFSTPRRQRNFSSTNTLRGNGHIGTHASTRNTRSHSNSRITPDNRINMLGGHADTSHARSSVNSIGETKFPQFSQSNGHSTRVLDANSLNRHNPIMARQKDTRLTNFWSSLNTVLQPKHGVVSSHNHNGLIGNGDSTRNSNGWPPQSSSQDSHFPGQLNFGNSLQDNLGKILVGMNNHKNQDLVDRLIHSLNGNSGGKNNHLDTANQQVNTPNNVNGRHSNRDVTTNNAVVTQANSQLNHDLVNKLINSLNANSGSSRSHIDNKNQHLNNHNNENAHQSNRNVSNSNPIAAPSSNHVNHATGYGHGVIVIQNPGGGTASDNSTGRIGNIQVIQNSVVHPSTHTLPHAQTIERTVNKKHVVNQASPTLIHIINPNDHSSHHISPSTSSVPDSPVIRGSEQNAPAGNAHVILLRDATTPYNPHVATPTPFPFYHEMESSVLHDIYSEISDPILAGHFLNSVLNPPRHYVNAVHDGIGGSPIVLPSSTGYDISTLDSSGTAVQTIRIVRRKDNNVGIGGGVVVSGSGSGAPSMSTSLTNTQQRPGKHTHRGRGRIRMEEPPEIEAEEMTTTTTTMAPRVTKNTKPKPNLFTTVATAKTLPLSRKH